MLHGLQVGQDLVAQRLRVDLLGAQPHARDRRLQVVRDGGQQVQALGQLPLDATLHRLERAQGLLDLDGAVGDALQLLVSAAADQHG